jgi:thiamine pyrophosphate-dependent acetolactate synthase large subunit-like protein
MTRRAGDAFLDRAPLVALTGRADLERMHKESHQYVLREIRHAPGRDDVLISDVGLHKLWIGRMYPAHEPNTCLIANGLAGTLPSATRTS